MQIRKAIVSASFSIGVLDALSTRRRREGSRGDYHCWGELPHQVTRSACVLTAGRQSLLHRSRGTNGRDGGGWGGGTFSPSCRNPQPIGGGGGEKEKDTCATNWCMPQVELGARTRRSLTPARVCMLAYMYTDVERHHLPAEKAEEYSFDFAGDATGAKDTGLRLTHGLRCVNCSAGDAHG